MAEPEPILPPEYREGYDSYDGPGPLVRASEASNINILKQVLKTTKESPSLNQNETMNNLYTSPLLTAIHAKLPENARLLLAHGADPNGMETDYLSEYSVRFLRFRPPTEHGRTYHSVPPRDRLLSLPELSAQPEVFEKTRRKARPRPQYPQNHPELTEQELEPRRKCRVRFWAEVNFPGEIPEPLGRTRRGAMTAVEAAARIGDVELIDELIEKDADVSFWQLPVQKEIPFPLTPSAISVSSPLHGAVEARNMEAVKHLLAKHKFNPNTFPLAAITRCISPLMLSAAEKNLEIYKVLSTSPLADHSLRTPVYGVHILHFAVATLSPELFHRVVKDHPGDFVTAAGTTTLGHTLLHIACLPLEDSYINVFSEKVYKSIHEVRTTSTIWQYTYLSARYPLPSNIDSRPAKFPPTPDNSYFPDQLSIVEAILQSCSSPEQASNLITAQDVHGNTALHYLAGHRELNWKLIQLLRNAPGGEKAWMEKKNIWGYTPVELFDEQKEAEGTKEGGMFKKKEFWYDRSGIVLFGEEID